MHSESMKAHLKMSQKKQIWSKQANLLHFETSRNRLPSLYSDFTLQKTTNPDGYAVNVAAWEHALIKAARNGYISRDAGTGSGGKAAMKSSHLVLKANEYLLRDLEIPGLGQPVALSTVIVCIFYSWFRCCQLIIRRTCANYVVSRMKRFKNELWSRCSYTSAPREVYARVNGALLIQAY